MEDIIQKVRQGEITLIRFDNEAHLRDVDVPPDGGYLMLPATGVSAESLDRLLWLTGAAPMFTTTRDRLEQMGVFAKPASDPEGCVFAADMPGGGGAAPPPLQTDELVTAAGCLAGTSDASPQAALDGVNLCCADWGGVVNCPRPFEAAVDLCRLAGLAPAAVLSRYVPGRSREGGARGLPAVSIAALTEYRKLRASTPLPRSGPRTRLPTRYGNFNLQAYEDPLSGQLHIALWMGDLQGPVLTRIHSECLTGDLFGSLRCDCGNQLALALSGIAEKGEGILLYLRQEGRGIGLVNKLRSYALQDQGLDTVEANQRLGFEADLRDYGVAGQMLEDLGVTRVQLMTNNPRKIRGLERYGIQVETRTPLVVEPCSDSQAYLEVKRRKLGHWLP